ncbi:MAG: hypothetical protein J5651_05400 [Salinivirgaceae bacterium]|nr:hypothetical protein [Salinivirgaceae bacterium]MBO7594902.1 hypothetical protein [Salinivirgaceae bacterium]
MRKLLLILTIAAVVVACKEPRSWCPIEVSVPIVSADIPDTVDAGQKFTADFVLDKGECIKEYGMKCSRRHDTIWFSGAAIQDYCDEFPDTAKVEKSVMLSLGDSTRYVAIYDMLIGDDQTMSVVPVSKYIVVRK